MLRSAQEAAVVAEEVPIAAAGAFPSCRASFTDEGYLMRLRHAGEAVEAIRGATAA